MNIRELLKRDHGIEVRISAGIGRPSDPYVVEKCDAEESSLTQMQLLRGIGRGLSELWRIEEWKPCDDGSATEVIRLKGLRFTPTEIEILTRSVYFDTRAVAGSPYSLHPLTVWQGPPGSVVLPYELGWLHFDRALDNAPSAENFDHTILYSGVGAKASVYVYGRPSEDPTGARDAELKRASANLQNPKLEDPWPVAELGPFAMKFFLSEEDITAVGVAVSGLYFVKVRLTYFDNSKMRDLMNSTLMALGACLQCASAHKR